MPKVRMYHDSGMILVLVRHAIAEDRETFAKSGEADTERPLTLEGKAKMKLGARGLEKILAKVSKKVDLIASSPLRRALQTADLLDHSLQPNHREIWHELEPGISAEKVIGKLTSLQPPFQSGLVVLVGHEPNLSSLVNSLVSSWAASQLGRASNLGESAVSNTTWIEFKKGAACAFKLSFESSGAFGNVKMLWHLSPAVLRRIGR